MPSIQNSKIGQTIVIETRPVVSLGWRKGLTAKEQGLWWWRLHDWIQLLRLSKCTIKMGHLLYVNYTSIKLSMGEIYIFIYIYI